MNILIAGIPNVGKTSLYNIICLEDKNIIHKTIGTTRDWHVSPLKSNKNINIYDTPGIIAKNKFLDKHINYLIKKINLILFVIDFKSNSFENDKSLLHSLRKFGKQIILVVNKDDNIDQNIDLSSFGIKDVFYISCSHRIGIRELLFFLSKYEVQKINTIKFDYSIGLFGKTNVGKSTLLNKLVGFNRSIVSDIPKTTTDVVSSNYKYKSKYYSIKDTAGLIKKNKIDKNSLDYYVTKKTISIIKDIDVNIFMIDVQQGFDTQSKKIFNLIYNESNTLLFLINKVDLVKSNKIKFLSKIKNDIKKQFSQSKNLHIISLSTFNNKDINRLKKIISDLSIDVNKVISTSKINKWLNLISEKNPHSRIKGKEVKFKYATQISEKPLKIKIFSNFSKEISEHYKRYMLNNFYDFFKIKSKNIKLIFSKTSNPYD